MKNIQDITQQLLQSAVSRCADDGIVPADVPEVPITLPKKPEHGDFATSAALMLAKKAKRPPRELAQLIKDRIHDKDGILEAVEIAGPGFLNLRLSDEVWYRGLGAILEEGPDFGRAAPRQEGKINLEFVSANPTGPLHVGHGRGAAVGDSLARILRFAGYEVSSEYYLNDAGRQIRNLGLSVHVRALEILKASPQQDHEVEIPEFPEDGYHGAYVNDVAQALIDEKDAEWVASTQDIEAISSFAAGRLAEAIRKTLERFNVDRKSVV